MTRARALPVLAVALLLACTVAALSNGTPSGAFTPGATHRSAAHRSATPVDDTLTAVDCSARTSCVAVGRTATGGLIEVRHGSTWTATATTAVYGGGLSCVTATTCLSGGSSNTSPSPVVGLLEGTRWAPVPISGDDGSNVSSMSCSGSTCVGTGWWMNGDPMDFQLGSFAVVGTDTASGWTQIPFDFPFPDNGDPQILSVSCAAPTDCVAVGGFFGASAVVEVWDGAQWEPQYPIVPLTTRAGFDAVSCPGIHDCLAIGYDGGMPLFEHQNASGWRTLARPPVGSFTSLSCASRSMCLAVGTDDGTTMTPVAALWNGASWTSLTVPVPHGTSSAGLNSVSCPSADGCVAVGQVDSVSNTSALAERFASGKMSLIRLPAQG